MGTYRTVISYKTYFEEFLDEQSPKVQRKILQILRLLEEIEMIPESYLKHIAGTDGLYEVRIVFGSDIFRVFCFFDEGRMVVLLGGFHKKTARTPVKEIEKALRLMKEYNKEKQI